MHPPPPLIDRHSPVARPWQQRRLVLLLSLVLLLTGCGGSGGSGEAGSGGGSSVVDGSTGDVSSADITVLMIGNSHTRGADLPLHLYRALAAALPARRVAVVVAPSSLFLDEHLQDATTRQLLAARRWSAVVLQAQKYSSSGQFSYSTAEAEQLVRLARAQGAVPVLYPEWARLGVDEAARIWELHRGIAGREPACVAPIPQAWNAALAAEPTLPLHDADGNHAAAAGGVLTALVLQATITTVAPATLPDLPGAGSPPQQDRLRDAASAALATEPARRHCPVDPAVR